MCGSILGGAYLGTKLPAYTQAAAPPCTSLYRLTWSASTAAYGVDCSKYVAQASYYYCNDGGGTTNIADSVIDSTYSNAVGQPYTVTMTLGKTIDQSDDGTLTYIARLNTAPLNSADMKKVYYVQYSSATRTAVAAYNGTGNLSPSWTVFTSPRVYKAQLTWNQAINTLNMGGTATMIDTGTTTINCNSGGNTVTSCTNASSWFNTTGQQPAANTGGGQFVLQARYPNGLSVSSSIGQF